MNLRRFTIITSACCALWVTTSALAQTVRYEKLENGKVEHWYHKLEQDKRSWLQIQIENISNVIWPDDSKAPFGSG